MAVTKRTRFEVLRRDNFTCQYCGAAAPDAVLQIDHVTPVALGGDDKPGNLVTACRDCNGGKASIPPGSPMVESLSAAAAAYALGMIDKMTKMRADLESLDDYDSEFRSIWDAWGRGEGDSRVAISLPHDYRMTLFRWKQMGVPLSVFELAVPTAMSRQGVRDDARFAYFAGIVWNMINEREIDYSVREDSAAVYTSNEAEEYAQRSWSDGRRSGEAIGRQRHAEEVEQRDYLQHHIDQMELMFEPNPFTDEPMYMGMKKRGT